MTMPGTLPNLPVLPVLVAIGVCLAATWLLADLRRRGSTFRAADYAGKPLLTRWELAALGEMTGDLPAGLHICPQVRLADLLSLTVDDPARRVGSLRWVAAKSVDFVIIDPSGRALLVVELDDRTHLRPERRERDHMVDAVLRRCGIPVLRVRPGQRIDVRSALWSRLLSAQG